MYSPPPSYADCHWFAQCPAESMWLLAPTRTANPFEQPFQRAPPQYGGESLPRVASFGAATSDRTCSGTEAFSRARSRVSTARREAPGATVTSSRDPSTTGVTEVTPLERATSRACACRVFRLWAAGTTLTATVRRAASRAFLARPVGLPCQYTVSLRFSADT